jgi:hypothetical protein
LLTTFSKGGNDLMSEVKQAWWVFMDKRTNPGRYHRQLADGNYVGSVEIIRAGDTDAPELGNKVELLKVTPVHLDPVLGAKILTDIQTGGNLSSSWREGLWGPNGEWMGQRGILFVWEGEYPSDKVDDIFAALMKVQTDGPPAGRVPNVTQEVEDVSGMGNVGGGPAPTAPRPQPAPSASRQADTDRSGKVSAEERDAWNAEHPDQPVERGKVK